MQKYDSSGIAEQLRSLSGWAHENDAIIKNFVFKNFSEAFAFLARVALVSEQLDHHAEWSGVYNKVTLRLRTHDADGVTDKDFKFAQKVEEF